MVGMECNDAAFQEDREGDHGRDRVRQCGLLMSFQEGLKGDCGKDRVQRCHLNIISRRSTPEIVLSRKKSFPQNSASKMANSIVVDIVKYLCYYWQTLSNSFLFSFTKIWSQDESLRRRKKDKIEDERWARLDEKIDSLTLQ